MITINGETRLIAHIGYPTFSFKAPMIYNPYFASIGLNAAVVPMGIKAEHYGAAFKTIFQMTNVDGALITMPHKVTTATMLNQASTAVKIAGSCNAVRVGEDGSLIGDIFDGEGFVRGLLRKGKKLAGASALVVGCGGVGSAIAASLAAAKIGQISLFDLDTAAMDLLANRITQHYSGLVLSTGSNDPSGFDFVVNATPLGMNQDDPMPLDMARLAPTTFVGEVVMKQEMTAFLAAAIARGCDIQVGTDMLFEQIPAYLEFFGYQTTTPDHLRRLARFST